MGLDFGSLSLVDSIGRYRYCTLNQLFHTINFQKFIWHLPIDKKKDLFREHSQSLDYRYFALVFADEKSFPDVFFSGLRVSDIAERVKSEFSSS